MRPIDSPFNAFSRPRRACTAILPVVAWVAFALATRPAIGQSTATMKPITDFRADWMGFVAQSPGGQRIALDSYAGDTLFVFDRTTRAWTRLPGGAENNGAFAPNGRFQASFRRIGGSDRRAFLWVTPTDPATSAPTGAARRVSLRPTNDVAWSSDSRRIAFISNDSGKTRLVVTPFNGGEDAVLDEDEGWSRSLDWTPDGNSLVFARRAEGGPAYRLMRYDFRSSKTVAGPVLHGAKLQGTSLDGRFVASTDTTSNSIVVYRVADFREVQRVRLPARQWLDPLAWSATEGNAIIAIERFLPTHLQQVDFSTGRITPISPADSSYFSDPSYSPDGARIAYLRGSRTERQLYVANRDGTGARPLGSPGKQSKVAWSPRGDALLYCDANAVHVANPATGADRVLARGTLVLNARGQQPCAWRSDGQAVRFFVRVQSPVFERQLREVSVAGAERVIHTFRNGGAVQMLDDTTMLLNNGLELAQKHVISGELQKLYPGKLGVRHTSLSPDKSTIAVAATEGNRWIPMLIDRRTRVARSVPYSLPGEIAGMRFHPDGRHLLVESCLTCVDEQYVEKFDNVMLPINGDPAKVITAPLRSYKDFGPVAPSPDGRFGVFESQPSYNTRVVSLTLPPLR